MSRHLRALAGLFALWLLPLLAHATVQASLDRSTAHLGETVTLNLHSNTAPIDAPDLSALSQDFQVLGKSSGTTASFANGQRTIDYSYGVALRPLHEGTLRIPPITVGNEQTQPLTLEVTAASQASADVHGPVYVEASIDPLHPYVGRRVRGRDNDRKMQLRRTGFFIVYRVYPRLRMIRIVSLAPKASLAHRR